MDIQTLKSEHPETYNAIFNKGKEVGKSEGVSVGISAEKDRVGSWLAHSNTNIEKVIAGIKEGGVITATAREEFLVAAATAGKKDDLQSDNNPDVITSESGAKPQLTEAESFYADVLKNI